VGEERKVYKVLVGKPEGRDHLEDQGVDGIRMDLREIDLGGVDWIQLAQDRDRWRALGEYSDEPAGSGATELVIMIQVVIFSALSAT
jgi:hypothetical protein